MKKNDIIKMFGEDLHEFLSACYIEDKLSTTEIAKVLEEHLGRHVNAGNVWILLKHFDIPIRSMSDSISMSKMFLDVNKSCLDSDLKMQTLDGLMISDGSIVSCGKYHRFGISSSQKEFIDYCYKQLSDLISDFPSFSPYKNPQNGRVGTWGIRTGIHPDFTEQYNRWYKNGVKIIPKDVSLSPISLMLWYYGDGTLINSKSGNSCTLRLSTDSFTPDDIDMLIERMHKELNIDAVRTTEGRIRLKTYSIPTFINFIGRKPILSCYSYKFDIDDWRFWKPMKLVAKEIGIPYSRLSHLVKLKAVNFNRSPGGKKVMFTEKQVEELRSLHNSNALIADARVSNIAVSKNKFNKVPFNLRLHLNSVRQNGFPYINLEPSSLLSSFHHLKNVPIIHINDRDFDANYRDNELAINFHPHMYRVQCGDDKSPIEAFEDDAIMSEIIEERINKGQLLQGADFLNRICRHNRVKRTSVFPVRVAKTLFSYFGHDNMNVLDPCAGYSSRLIGFMTQGYSGSYTGIDPCKMTIEGLHNTISTLGELDDIDHTYNIICGCAETEMQKFNSDSFDLIFSSPPYFNLEKYDTEETQSYIKYSEYDKWLHEFLFVIIEQAKRLMKDKGVFLLNVGNPRGHNLISDVDNYVKDVFRVENVLMMHSPSIWHDTTTEPIFVLRKN